MKKKELMSLIQFIITILVVWLLMFGLLGCKARKTDKQTLAITDKSTLAITQQNDKLTIDTSKKLTQLNINAADSSGNQLEIVNDSGKVINVDIAPDGSFHYTGSAKGIKFKSNKKHHQLTNQTTNEHKAVTTHQQQNKQSLQKNNTKLNAGVKTTESKSDIGEVISIVICVLVIGVALLIGFKTWQISRKS